MTRCKDFYAKLEKDGDFCGLGAEYRRAMQYMEYCKTHNIEVGSISQGEWRKRVTERKELDNPSPKETPSGETKKPEETEPEETEPIEKDKKAIAGTNEKDESEMDTYIRIKQSLNELEKDITKLVTLDMKVKSISEMLAIVKRIKK